MDDPKPALALPGRPAMFKSTASDLGRKRIHAGPAGKHLYRYGGVRLEPALPHYFHFLAAAREPGGAAFTGRTSPCSVDVD
jgi:hypothetical protein